MGLVGGVNVVDEPPAPPGVSIIEDPLRSPVTKALALSVEPAKELNSEASLLAGTELALLDVVVPVAAVVVSAPNEDGIAVGKARIPAVSNVSIESFAFMGILLNERLKLLPLFDAATPKHSVGLLIV